MGTINPLLTDSEFEILLAICETLAPAIEGERRGFFGSIASELKVAEGVDGAIASAAPTMASGTTKRRWLTTSSP